MPLHLRWNVIGHDVKAFGRDDLSPHDLLGLLSIGDIAGIAIGHQSEFAAENSLVELKRRAGITAEVEMGRGLDGHWLSALLV